MIEIKEKAACCGCESCLQRCPAHCITIREDEEGFPYPVVKKESCTECGLCEKVCPVLRPEGQRKPLELYAAKNKNKEIRKNSSSGGIFTILAEQILSENGVVFGARFNEYWEVEHGYTEQTDGLAAFRGSKYVQSRIGVSYQETERFLKAGRRVLFSGTPCQIAGLHRFLRKRYDNLLTVDFICHGVPSPGVWRKYLKRIMAHEANENTPDALSADWKDKISDISFRDKTLGWRTFSLVIRDALPKSGNRTNRLSENLYKNIYLRGFLKNLYLRPSCYACPSKSFKSGSDVTLGDFWGIERVLPRLDDNRGVSAVMLNTPQAVRLWHSCRPNCQTVTYPEILQMNPALEKSPREPENRKIFFSKATNDIISLIEWLAPVPWHVGLKRWIAGRYKSFLVNTGWYSFAGLLRKNKKL